MLERKSLSEFSIIGKEAHTIILLMALIMGIVVLFHDYPGHDHLALLHDFIADDVDIAVLSLAGLWEHIDADGASSYGIPNTGMRPPPHGIVTHYISQYLYFPHPHSDEIHAIIGQLYGAFPQTIIKDRFYQKGLLSVQTVYESI